MDVIEAWELLQHYYGNAAPTEEENKAFVDASRFLLRSGEEGTSRDIIVCKLAQYYYENDQFDEARKYLKQMAVASRSTVRSAALQKLGYLWYYGRTGNVDYRRAYECAVHAAKSGKESLKSKCLLYSLMFKGQGLPKGGHLNFDNFDYPLLQLFDQVMKSEDDGTFKVPVPEVKLLTARLFQTERLGYDEESAHTLLQDAREYQLQRLRISRDPDELSLMEEIVKQDTLHKKSDTIDIYELFREEGDVRMHFTYLCDDFEVRLHGGPRAGMAAVEFEGKLYPTVYTFFREAKIEGQKLNFLADKMTNITIGRVPCSPM